MCVPANCVFQQTQNICITFTQRRPNVFDVGPTLYKCYTNVAVFISAVHWESTCVYCDFSAYMLSRESWCVKWIRLVIQHWIWWTRVTSTINWWNLNSVNSTSAGWRLPTLLRWHLHLNPWSTKRRNLHFQPLEVVSRYRDPQLQVTENVCYLWNLTLNIYQCFKIEGIFYF